MKTTYSVVVESGSCDPTYSRWGAHMHCGHHHRTIGAAEQCLAEKTQMYCQHGNKAEKHCDCCLGGYAHAQNCSADWYNACIHDQDEHRVKKEEINA